MKSKVPFYLLVFALVVVGVALSVLRHQNYGVPWTPGQMRQVWDIEARVEFDAIGDPVKVSLASPQTQTGYTLLERTPISSGYSADFIEKSNNHRVEWTTRSAEGPQITYLRTLFLVDNNAQINHEPPTETTFEPVVFKGPEESAARTILEEATNRSSDDISLTRELIKSINNSDNQNAVLLLSEYSKDDLLSKLLTAAKVHTNKVATIMLEDGRRRQSITTMIRVWDGEAWVLFDPNNSEVNSQQNLLVWGDTDVSLLDVMGGKNSQVHFSMLKQDMPPRLATDKKVEADGLLNFSIHSLPLEEQSMFKTIMLIPIGAFIVVFLRILIGLKTSGTFMPVLIAVAFVQTELINGIIGFLVIVGTGLVIRSYLSKLNLLLVARISAVIITVILIIAIFTVVAFNIGLQEGLSITFFPMIILSWTIERMSILWEEEGPKEVFMQGGGSLLTSVLVYLAMTNSYVQHLTFNFIGVQLIILALILMLGTYTGYRLTELRRFKPLAEE